MQALLLLSLFMLTLALVAEFGSLRAKSLRLQSAFDRAALAATGAIDPRALAADGRLRLHAAAAEDAARTYLEANLAPLEGALAGTTAVEIAADARVDVSTGTAPAVAISAAIDLPSGLLSLIGADPALTYRIRSASELKGP